MGTLYAREVNALPEGYHDKVTRKIERRVYWTATGLRIIRFRCVTDPGFPLLDVSYCHGKLGDKYVEVLLPFDQLPKRGWRKAIVEYAKRDGIYAAGTGIFENFSLLW